MVTERAFNPIPILVHLIAIALGLYLGWQVMGAITPDLPDDDVVPGVSTSTDPAAVAPDDPDSLFRTSNLAPALAQLDDQVAAGEGIVTLHIEPGSLEAETGSGEGTFQRTDVIPNVPELLVDEIHARRAGVTLADIGYMDLVATRGGPRWYVQLDTGRTDVSPPWTYGAPMSGKPVTAGGAPPEPVGG